MEWIKPESLGKPPSARYLHTLNYYEEGNFLILYGGRNDYNSDNFALDDIFLLELTRLEWVEVKVYSDTPINVYSRCGHSAVVFCMIFFNLAHNLIVMGGMNNNNYIGSSLFFIELSKYEINEDSLNISKEEKIEKKRMEILLADEILNKNDILKIKKRLVGKSVVHTNYNLILPPIK